MDLFSITTPFGLLPPETQQALREWKGPVQFYSTRGEWLTTAGKPYFDFHMAYRAKPLPLTKPSINWDHVSKEWNWLARDQNESMWLFTQKPYIGEYCWKAKAGDNYIKTYMFSSVISGTCDWKDSLVERPMKEDKNFNFFALPKDSVEDLM
jgi:hypothetical protein